MKLRRSAVAVFTLALLVVGAAVVTNVVPYRQILEQRRQVATAAAQLDEIRDENAVLTAQREALQTPVEIERLAREKLGYVRPGEIAYVVLDPPEVSTTTSSTPTEDPVPVEDDSLLDTVWDFMTGADLTG